DLIWVPVSQGMKPTEIAASLHRAPSWVSDRLKEFYTEALFQQGIFPPLPDDEYQALKDSIQAVGVQVPIVVDEYGEVIDGRVRRHIARELGITCPFETRTGLSLDERRELAVTLNGPRSSHEPPAEEAACRLRVDGVAGQVGPGHRETGGRPPRNGREGPRRA
ncbi:MAG TPA: ParB N-terminal domain-containing protein, partial [Candidatus Dormibacteraeota bacterium]